MRTDNISSLPNFTASNVTEVLTDWIFLKKMFTAYDVTLRLRELSLKAFHAQVKTEVHDFMTAAKTNPVYLRSQHEVNSETGVMAFVYHPHGADLNKYESYIYKEFKSKIDSVAAIAPPKTTNQNVAKQPPTTFSRLKISIDCVGKGMRNTTDSRGTYCVSNRLVEGLGAKPFTKVYWSIEDNALKNSDLPSNLILSIKLQDPLCKDLSKQYYTVDSSGNIRITGHTLEKVFGANFCKGVYFNCELVA